MKDTRTNMHGLHVTEYERGVGCIRALLIMLFIFGSLLLTPRKKIYQFIHTIQSLRFFKIHQFAFKPLSLCPAHTFMSNSITRVLHLSLSERDSVIMTTSSYHIALPTGNKSHKDICISAKIGYSFSLKSIVMQMKLVLSSYYSYIHSK